MAGALRSDFEHRLASLDLDRSRLKAICQAFNLYLVVLFGSYGTGRATRHSDVDRAVGTRRTLIDRAFKVQLLERLGELVYPKTLDLVLLNRVGPLLMVFCITLSAQCTENPFTDPVSMEQDTTTTIADSSKAQVPLHFDPWFGQDKFLHFGISAGLTAIGYQGGRHLLDRGEARARWIAIGGTVSVGVFKELWDRRRPGSFFSLRDLVADGLGIVVGLVLFTMW